MDIEEFLGQYPDRAAAAAMARVVFAGQSLRDQRGCGVGTGALLLCRDALWERVQ